MNSSRHQGDRALFDAVGEAVACFARLLLAGRAPRFMTVLLESLWNQIKATNRSNGFGFG